MADGEKGGTTTPPVPTDPWKDRIGSFAEAVGKNIEDINGALKGVVGDPGEPALSVLDNTEAVPDGDLIAAFKDLNIPSGVLKQHLKKLRSAAVLAAVSTGADAVGNPLALLPTLPDDESFLKDLQTGGVLKNGVGQTEVLSAVKAGLANQVGLFDAPERILAAMEEFATKQDQPISEDFVELQHLLTQSKYGDVFAALKINGRFMTDKRKAELLAKVDGRLLPALTKFNQQLLNWRDAWMGNANPMMMMAAMTAHQVGGSMPPGMMAPPDPAAVRASGRFVIDEMNGVFSGYGVVIARALAYDATRIMTILKNPKLPAQVGTTTKEQMLKEIGLSVSADVVQAEQNLTRYTLAIMELPGASPDKEAVYLGALLQLSASIPWGNLQPGRAGIGGNGAIRVKAGIQ